MHGERSMIAEAVERGAACQASDERAVLALIEKRSGFLSFPRRRHVADVVLRDLDFAGHITKKQLGFKRESFFLAQRYVVTREYSARPLQFMQRGDDFAAKNLEAGAHYLHREPAIVTIADQ